MRKAPVSPWEVLTEEEKVVLKRNLIDVLNNVTRAFTRLSNSIGASTSVAGVIEAKRAFLISFVEDLPISGATCPYCNKLYVNTRVVMSREEIEGLTQEELERTEMGQIGFTCDVCTFGKQHGKCDSPDSDWASIKNAKKGLITLIDKVYKVKEGR